MLWLTKKLLRSASGFNAHHFSRLSRRCCRAALLCLAVVWPFVGISNACAQALAPGNVVGWGEGRYTNSVPAGLTGVTAISAGGYHGLALKSDGTVVSWGRNFYHQTDVPAGLSNVTAIAAGFYVSLALKNDGAVVGWGDNASGLLNIPPGLSNVTAIAAGVTHNLALKSDGTVVGWGSDSNGQIDIPANLSGVTAIAGGYAHSLALKNDGTVVGWGSNNYQQTDVPAGLSGVTAIAAGSVYSLALKSDGTVVGWGHPAYGANVPTGLSGVIAIAAGAFHSLALKSDGTIVAWGYNDYGLNNIPAPSGLSGVTAIAAGSYSLAANTTRVDTTPPTVTMVAPMQNARYMIQQRVTVSYSCTDPSTVTLCSGSLPVGALLDTSRLGPQIFTVTATDGRGNTGSTLINYTVQAQPTTLPPTTPPRRR